MLERCLDTINGDKLYLLLDSGASELKGLNLILIIMAARKKPLIKNALFESLLIAEDFPQEEEEEEKDDRKRDEDVVPPITSHVAKIIISKIFSSFLISIMKSLIFCLCDRYYR